jgi:Carboxypeptidase regulatory-like domain/TonB dependent receptor
VWALEDQVNQYSNSRKLRNFAVPAAILLMTLTPQKRAEAQNLYGSLTGNITDSTGGAIAGAKVVVTSTAENSSRDTASNTSGEYNVANLLPGEYSVQITTSGYETFRADTVQVTLGNTSRIDAHLLVGRASEQVVIHADTSALQTEQSDVRDEISSRALEDLPTPIGRNYQAEIANIPGTVVTGGGAVRGSNPAAAFYIMSNGVPRELDNVRIDGASAVNNFAQYESAYVPGLDAIQSVDVVTNASDAGTGLVGGASVNVQIKSGTNQLHGEAYETNSNNAFEARPELFPVGQRLPLLIYNQFGGTIGGPIRKDKLFYFLSYDGVISRQAYSTYATVPTDAAKAGNFSSESATPIYDPATGNPDGSGRTAFSGNQIPISRFSPISQKILALWPEPNQPGVTNNYFVSTTSPYDRHTVDGKINYNISKNLIVTGHLGYLVWNSYYNTLFGTALGGAAISGQQSGPANGTSVNLTTAVTYVLRPTLILDGYFGYNRSYENVLPQDYGKNIGTDFLGIPGTNGPNIVSSGWPLISLSGLYSGIGVDQPYMPWIRHDPGFDYVANFNWTRSTHNIRFGAEFQRRDLNHIQPEIEGQIGGAAGGFVFTEGVTQLKGGAAGNQDNVFADFLLGMPQQMGTTLQTSAQSQLRSNFYGLYIQDRWAVRPRLVVNYGVRWEYLPLPGRPGRGPEYYDSTTNTQLICGYQSVPRDCGIEMPKLGFSPRLGVAYSLSNTLVIRAGYGLARDPYDIGPRGLRVNYPDMVGQNYQGLNTFMPYENWALGIPPIVPPSLGNGILPVGATTVAHTIPRNFHRGYIQSRNLTIQKEFPNNLMLEASYVGTLDVHQIMQTDLNAGQVLGAGIAGENLYTQWGRTATTPEYAPIGTMNYNALQVRFQRRFAHGYSLGAGYAWSKAIGNSSDIESSPLVEATAYFAKNHGVLSYDRTNILHITGSWELPFGAGKQWANSGFLSVILGGWQTNGIFTAMSGLPFSVTASGTSLNMPGSTQFADQVAPVKYLGGHGPGHPWFSTSSFAAVSQARFGTVNPFSLRGPNLFNLDASIFRDIPIVENVRFQFRAEAFNLSNTPHWGLPGANVSSAGSFGIITGTDASYLGRSGTDQRLFRLSGKISF